MNLTREEVLVALVGLRNYQGRISEARAPALPDLESVIHKLSAEVPTIEHPEWCDLDDDCSCGIEEGSEHPHILIRDGQIQCPWCAVPNRIVELGSVLHVLPLTLANEEDQTLLLKPGEVSWDSYDFIGYGCEECEARVSIPEDFEIDDQS